MCFNVYILVIPQSVMCKSASLFNDIKCAIEKYIQYCSTRLTGDT